MTLQQYNVLLEILDLYSRFLEEHDYMDSDWHIEKPTAIDQFLKENPIKIKTDDIQRIS